MKEIEQEAMLEGNAILREYEDTVKNTETENMSLKEWKNNELNQLLMKKFGILKENKTSKYDDDPKLKGGQKDLPDGLQKGIINSTNEELDESNCGSHKRDDDVSEGKECDKCKDGDCKCDKIEETSDSSNKEEIQEALKRIANAKRIFLNNKRIR